MTHAVPPALNRLGNLLAPRIEYYGGRVYTVKAWDERSMNIVCWVVVDYLYNCELWDAEFIAEALRYVPEHPDYPYVVGLAYVVRATTIDETIFPMGVVRLDPQDYASIVSAARGGA